MRRRPRIHVVTAEAPISDLNTTPLIDVMLVLLIMFIMTMPMMTHKVAVDLPVETPPPVDVKPVVYRLHLERDGHLRWNGMRISEASLLARLPAVRDEPGSELHLAADGAARYEDYDRLLAAIKGAGITRLGLVDNARFVSDLG